jgi:zinc/manganese transport system permease protein
VIEAWPWFAFPLLALAAGCIALAPLGAQVLARGVVFIDLAVAQGAAAAALWAAVWFDHPGPVTVQGFALAGGLLAAALVAALVRRRPAGREALIGLVYVAGAAVAVLGAFDSPHGNEHLARMLAADLLWADPMQALTLAAAAAAILAVHRLRPDIWARDAVFYPGFALVAGVAVPALGLFVVFACLIVPALWMRAGWRLTPALGMTLVAGAAGLAMSWGLDRPSGACVALALAMAGLASVLRPLAERPA